LSRGREREREGRELEWGMRRWTNLFVRMRRGREIKVMTAETIAIRRPDGLGTVVPLGRKVEEAPRKMMVIAKLME